MNGKIIGRLHGETALVAGAGAESNEAYVSEFLLGSHARGGIGHRLRLARLTRRR